MPQSDPHSDFQLLRAKRIQDLRVEAIEYRHRTTGAIHLHLAAEHPENVFLVALRTAPSDDTGVAHILEHTLLCGSQRFPVRDPFFMMLRRSVNTFLNALTSSDWTAYPLASCNRKDFDNLLQVYLDAVFFPLLDPLDFAQEGHHLAFSDPNDSDSPLEYKGVVFNEMKGAMSSPVSALWQALSKHLYPDTAYRFNSGGDPGDIPKLSWEQLRAFHRDCYQPGNAIFATFGDIPAREHQQRFSELALKRFPANGAGVRNVPAQERLGAPLQASEPYAVSGDGKGKTHVVCAWLLGDTTDLDALLEAQLLAGALLDNSASPLHKALEAYEGGSISPLCGLDDSQRDLCFVCGVEGVDPQDAPAVEQLILDTLAEAANRGFEAEDIEAALHQIEVSHRDNSGSAYPYGLQLIMRCLPMLVHGGDAVATLEIDTALAKLRSLSENADWLRALVRRQLLDNPHRVRLSLCPDTQLADQTRERERRHLDELQASLSEQRKQQILTTMRELLERQSAKQNPDVLPKISLRDIPESAPLPTAQTVQIAAQPASSYQQPCNGIVSQDIVLDLPKLAPSLVQLLPLYTLALPRLGVGARDYLAVQRLQALCCSEFSAGYHLLPLPEGGGETHVQITLRSSALMRHAPRQCQLLRDTLHELRLDEAPRLVNLVEQRIAQIERGVTGRGHLLAAAAASRASSATAQLKHSLTGLPSLQLWKGYLQALRDEPGRAQLLDQLSALHEIARSAPRTFLAIGDAVHLEQYVRVADQSWGPPPANGVAKPARAQLQSELAACLTQLAQGSDGKQPRVREHWVSSYSQVNFCARSWPSTYQTHPDSPALSVLGALMRNTALHGAVREQGGAYGVNARQNSATATFTCASYRDPRLQETLDDFDAAAAKLGNGEFDREELEEAVLNVVSALDKPASPADHARQHFYSNLHGLSDRDWRRYRSAALKVSQQDIQRVAQTYLRPELASTAVLTGDNVASLPDFKRMTV